MDLALHFGRGARANCKKMGLTAADKRSFWRKRTRAKAFSLPHPPLSEIQLLEIDRAAPLGVSAAKLNPRAGETRAGCAACPILSRGNTVDKTGAGD